MSEEKKQALNNEVQNILNLINQNYTPESDSEWLSTLIDKYHHPNRYKTKEEIEAETKPMLLELFSEFLVKHKLSEVRKKNFRVIQRTLARYELYVRATKKGKRTLFSMLIPSPLKHFGTCGTSSRTNTNIMNCTQAFMKPFLKKDSATTWKNTLIDCFSRIRTFFLWCFDNKLTTNRPFDKFPIEECKYGTPVYINLEERDRIFNADLSASPQLEIQRDIFIFQTLIGCRVSDLYRMTKLNVVNEAIEYIPKKTKEGNPVTVRVPLNDKAKEILERYKDHEGKLLPFISEQKYNEAIKRYSNFQEWTGLSLY